MGGEGRELGRGANPSDEHGRGRDARRLRHRVDARGRGRGLNPHHRFGRRGAARTFLRGADRRRRERRGRRVALPLRRADRGRAENLSTREGSRSAMSIKPSDVRFDERGLVPAVVQDARTREVLTLASMNEESLRRTLSEGETWFWWRPR